MEGVLRETEHILTRGRMDLPLSLCFAAGDDLLLQQLLKRGVDPNEADTNGKTALHIAASNGNENCMLLLLDYGADPNSRGISRIQIIFPQLSETASLLLVPVKFSCLQIWKEVYHYERQ